MSKRHTINFEQCYCSLTDFYDNVDFNELFLDYSFDNDIDAECLVSFNTNCSEISFAFKFGNYRDESEEIAE